MIHTIIDLYDVFRGDIQCSGEPREEVRSAAEEELCTDPYRYLYSEEFGYW